MKKKHLYYASINIIVNIVLFFLLIFLMLTEMINFSIVAVVLSPLGIQPGPEITFDFVSFALNASPFIFITSIIGTWIAYFKNSLKYFKLFILLSWGYIALVVVIYVILWLTI